MLALLEAVDHVGELALIVGLVVPEAEGVETLEGGEVRLADGRELVRRQQGVRERMRQRMERDQIVCSQHQSKQISYHVGPVYISSSSWH